MGTVHKHTCPRRLAVYPVGVLMGFTFGAHYGLKSGVYATIIPGGQEALYTAVGMCVGLVVGGGDNLKHAL